ncbi:MAG: hypothetical protein JSS65_02640 [Armatimonadetes bacterium]|nr:hypothetical protein [Armatimonadota bacterium]
MDKIGSVTLNCNLRRDVRLSDDIRCQEGDVLAVRIKNSKTTYNTLELTTGRFSALKEGDVVAGALGHRRALGGYAGHIPEKLAPGDTINLLNMGGVLGVCTSWSPVVGPPFECEVLGQVLEFPFLGSRVGVPASIKNAAVPLDETVGGDGPPVVAVVGTCMNSGKTEAAMALVQYFARAGLRVAAGKTTGVSLRRDVLAMLDSGAAEGMSFTDCGVVTTSEANAAHLAKTIINHLEEKSPDVIVIELGDGLMGDYGVQAILADKELSKRFTTVVLSANDPVGAWGGWRLLVDLYGLTPSVVTGPCTDNAAGIEGLRRDTGLVGHNARTSPSALAQAVMEKVGLKHG